jgi:hypothetical protein
MTSVKLKKAKVEVTESVEKTETVTPNRQEVAKQKALAAAQAKRDRRKERRLCFMLDVLGQEALEQRARGEGIDLRDYAKSRGITLDG